MESNVYIVLHADLPVFKIGKANDVPKRLGMFSRDFPIDERMAFYSSFCDEREAFRVEGLLHSLHRKANVAFSGGDGRTEWFCVSAFPVVLSALSALSGGKVYGCSEFYARDGERSPPVPKDADILSHLMSLTVSGSVRGVRVDGDTLAGHFASWISGDSADRKRINELLCRYHVRFLMVGCEAFLAVSYSLESGGRTEFDSCFSNLLERTHWRCSYKDELISLLPEERRFDPFFMKRRVRFGGVPYYCVLVSMEPFRPPPRLRLPEAVLDSEHLSELELLFS